MAVLQSYDREQKFVIFGGINNVYDKNKANLSNHAFMVEIVNVIWVSKEIEVAISMC